MKKSTILCFLIATVSWVNAQVVNQNAGWPNPAWTVTGSYATDPTAFESNPTTTANFAFDDDDALNGHEDNIAAESPVINLTPAFTAGQTWLTVTVQYGYRYFANDQLRLEYWNAGTSAWVAWEANIPGNNGSATDNYCTTITKTTYTSTNLSIANFTPTQLAGFRYRIAYDDDPAGTDWNYGFCFDSPTITSSTPPSCPTPTALAATFNHNSATFTWTENGSATLYNVEYGANGFTQGTGTLATGVTNQYSVSQLTPNTAYSYYVQAACGGSLNSTWAGPFNFTTLLTPPANDECVNAIPLTVNTDFLCGTTTAGTVAGATASATDATACFGSEDDDVWYSFVATSATHRITLSNIAGSVTDMYHSLWTGNCSALTLVPGTCSDPETSNPTGLTIGQTYFIRVNTYTATGGQNTTFNICVGTPPPAPANDECTGAIALTVNPDLACGTVTAGTVQSATASNTDNTACSGAEDDDVWFSFVATSPIHKISLSNVTGSATDMFHSVWTGNCSALTLVPGSCSDADTSAPAGLTVGQTYYVRVNTYTATGNQNTTFNICVGTPPAPPANDDCTGAIALTVNPDLSCTSVTAGTIAGATASATDAVACAGSEDDDVWYSFVATAATQTISLTNVAGSVTDMFHSVWTGNCSALTLVPGSCSDADTSAPTGLTVGQTYFIRVNTYTTVGAQTTTFNICVGTPPAPPANDECTGAIALTVNPDLACGTVTAGTVQSATASNTDTTACSGSEDDDVWYSFVATATTHRISLTNVAGSTTDMYHSVWTGNCSTLTLVTGSCSDADVSNPTGLVVGQTYFVRVNTYTATGGQTSTFNICIGTNPPPPANDLCAGAIALTPGGLFETNPLTTTNAGATNTEAIVPSCQSNVGNSVWYTVVVPASGNVTIETQTVTGGMTDSVVSAFTGTCGGTLTAVGCDDDGNTGANDAMSKLSLTGQTPGSTLYVSVWRWGGAASVAGAFVISAYDASLSNGSFDNANFTFYPNPVNNVLNLSYNKEISNVEVYNLIGQKVISNSFNANEAQVDMSHLSNGAYMVKVTSDNQVKTIKVIKQ